MDFNINILQAIWWIYFVPIMECMYIKAFLNAQQKLSLHCMFLSLIVACIHTQQETHKGSGSSDGRVKMGKYDTENLSLIIRCPLIGMSLAQGIIGHKVL